MGPAKVLLFVLCLYNTLIPVKDQLKKKMKKTQIMTIHCHKPKKRPEKVANRAASYLRAGTLVLTITFVHVTLTNLDTQDENKMLMYPKHDRFYQVQSVVNEPYLGPELERRASTQSWT